MTEVQTHPRVERPLPGGDVAIVNPLAIF